MNNKRFLITYSLIILFALPLVIYIYPKVHFLGGISFSKNSDEVSIIVRDFLDYTGHPLDEYYSRIRIQQNQSVAMIAKDRLGIRKSNSALRDSIPGYVRSIRWYIDPPNTIPAMFLPDQREQAPGNPRIYIDSNGRIAHFGISIPDTLTFPSLTEDEALSRAHRLINDYSRFSAEELTLDSISPIEQTNRTDWELTFTGEDPALKEHVTLSIVIAGNTITRYRESFDLPDHLAPERTNLLLQLQFLIVYTIIILLFLYLAIKRLRSGELGFQTAIPIGLITFVCFGMQFWIMNITEFEWIMLVILAINSLMVTIAIIIGWATSESIGRQTWREKFLPFDLLVRGHIFHSSIGKGIIRGIAFGLLVFHLHNGVTVIMNEITPMRINFPAEVINFINSSIAGIHVITQSFLASFTFSALFFIAFTSLVRQHSSSTLLIIGVPAMIIAIGHSASFLPLYGGFIVLFVYGLFFAWIFFRFDILTLLIAITVGELFEWGMVLFFIGESYYVQQGFIWAAGLACVWIIGMASLFTKDSKIDERKIAPSFQRFISERERLQQEFEIARDVQMSFLPSTTPRVNELDISARCIPAKEIGGDYYDFVRLDENNTGIIIGDVSGKGTKAAFYMTLAKGLIHSAAEKDLPPGRVLTKINRLFYNSTDAGAFISMVYGIYNAPARELILARAGHNPIVYYNRSTGKADFIRPKGIAIGLQKGSIFSENIHDVSLKVQSGDVIIFYTDGITEAMNKKREEFGNDRLFEIIKKYNNENAETILDGIFSTVNNFTNRAEQSDDMTMVVIKVI